MSLFKIMEHSSYTIPSFVLIVIFIMWTFFRVFKGIMVLYDLNSVKTYVGGILVCILLLGGGLLFYFDSIYDLSSYITFIIHYAQNIG